jgi:hypothetical protein
MLNAIMQNGIILNVVMLNAIMQNVIILSVVMLSVVAPRSNPRLHQKLLANSILIGRCYSDLNLDPIL